MGNAGIGTVLLSARNWLGRTWRGGSNSQHSLRHSNSSGRRRLGFALSNSGFSLLSLSIIVVTIVAASLLAGITYHLLAFGRTGKLLDFAAVGTLTALAYVMPLVIRDELRPRGTLGRRRDWRGDFSAWNSAIVSVIAIALLTKTTADYSRGSFLLFYGFGLAGVILASQLIATLYLKAIGSGGVLPRRVMLVGTAKELADWSARAQVVPPDVKVVIRLHLPEPEEGRAALSSALSRYAAKGRRLLLDDVVLLTPLTQPERIEQCVEAFSMLPVAIRLEAGALLSKFSHIETSHIGQMKALSLAEPPMAPLQAVIKRLGDIVAALAGLILLAPLFAVVALFIKLDSKGPVFFTQRRLGYNQEEFRIVKFRSMTTTDDGDKIVQAKQGDKRITRVGAFLRKSNIDELPQLYNVLKGDMSIVGPRPHAVAHDRDYEKRIVAYPRRLNVRPGITGWAQVNGWRGETDTDEKMQQRVAHDLYYIDHWSIGLDAYILLMTIFSLRAYRNAR